MHCPLLSGENSTISKEHPHTLQARAHSPRSNHKILLSQYLFHGAVDSVARLVEAGGGLLALGDDLLVQIAPLQRSHPPRVAHSLEVLDSGRIVQQHSTARLADTLRGEGGNAGRAHGEGVLRGYARQPSPSAGYADEFKSTLGPHCLYERIFLK